MTNTLTKATTKSSRPFGSVLFYSPVFPLLLALGAFYSWITWNQMAFIAILVAVAVYILVFFDDVTPLIPMVVMVVFGIRSISALSFIFLVSIAVPVFLAFTYHAIAYKNKKSLGKLFFPLLFVSIALAMGGVGSPYLNFYKLGVVLVITLGVMLLFIYVYFYNYCKPPKWLDFKSYFAYTLICMALACIFEYLYGILVMGYNGTKLIYLGWGGSNIIGSVYLFAYPAVFYLMAKNKRIFPHAFLAIIILVILTFIMASDGSKLLILAFTPFLIFYLATQMQGAKKVILYAIFYICIAGVGSIAIYLLFNDFSTIVKLAEKFLDPNGRVRIFTDAWLTFNAYPIFGVSMGYTYGINMTGANYHSTFFHIIATTGAFGLLCYIIYYYQRFRILLTQKTPFNICMFFGFLMMEIYSLVEQCEFWPLPLMVAITFMILSTDLTNSERPLGNKLLKFRQSMYLEIELLD